MAARTNARGGGCSDESPDDSDDEAETLLLFGIAEARRGHVAAANAALRRALLVAAGTGKTRLEREAWLALLEATARGAAGHDDGWSTVVASEAAIRRDPANWFWVHNRWKPARGKSTA